LTESGYREFLWYPRMANQFSKKDLVRNRRCTGAGDSRKRLKYRVFCLTAAGASRG